MGGRGTRGWHRQDRLTHRHSQVVRQPNPRRPHSRPQQAVVQTWSCRCQTARAQNTRKYLRSRLCAQLPSWFKTSPSLATQPPGRPLDSHDSDMGCLRCAPRPRPRASKPRQYARRHLVSLSHTLVSYRVPTIWQPVHTEGEQQMVQHPSARASPPLAPPPRVRTPCFCCLRSFHCSYIACRWFCLWSCRGVSASAGAGGVCVAWSLDEMVW